MIARRDRTPRCWIHRSAAFRALAVLLLVVVVSGRSAHALAPSPELLAVRVLDSATGQPLPGATVTTRPGGGTVTDEAGRAVFASLVPGRYEITARHLGYHPATLTLVLHEGDTRNVLLPLEPAPVLADTFTFTAAAPAGAGYRLDHEQVRARAGENVGELLRGLPGVQVLEAGGKGSRQTVSLRGSRPDQVRVEVDGVPLNSGSGEAPDLASIPAGAVRSVEVDPGVRPGAPGGSIRITTFSARDGEATWSAAAEAQDPRAWSGDLHARQASRGRVVSMHARYLDAAGAFRYVDESGGSRRRVNNDRRRLALSLQGSAPLGGWTVDAGAHADLLEAGSPGPLYQPPTPEAESSEQQWRSYLTVRGPGPRARTRASLYAGGSRRDFRSPALQETTGGGVVRQIPMQVEDASLRAGLSLHHRIPAQPALGGNLSLSSGGLAEAERFESLDRLSNGVAVSRTVGVIHRTRAAGDLRAVQQWRPAGWRIGVDGQLRGDMLRDQPGRWDTPWAAGATSALSGRLQTSAGPAGGGWTVDLGAGSAFQPPSFTHRFLSETVFALGNPSLRPERVREIDGGLSLARPLAASLHLAASLRGFRRETDDLIVWRRNWRGQYFPDNVARSTASGLELASSIRGDGLLRDLRLAGTWQRVVNATPGSPYEGRRIPFQPDLHGTASLRLAPLARLELLADLRLAGRRYTSESNLDPLSRAGGGLDPYGALDLQLRWTQPLTRSGLTLTTTAGVDNVTASAYQLLDRQPMPGRVWTLRLALRGVRKH